MSFLQSRASILRRRPLVVGTLTGHAGLAGQIRRACSPLVDVVEIRLDTFREIYTPAARSYSVALVQRVRRGCRKPLLLTFRSHTERGSATPVRERIGDDRREAILVPLLPAVALVDVEARRRPFARRVTSVARRLGVGVIHSFHDFKSAPAPLVLDRWCAEARRGGADIFKVAITPKDGQALAAFLAWGLRVEKMRCVLIGMGAAGAPSRTMGFSFGSILTYGHLGASAAPGQMPAAKLARAVRAIYGGGR